MTLLRLGAAILATAAALELGALALISWMPGWPSRTEIQRTLRAPEAPALPEVLGLEPKPFAMGNILHPFLGFVRKPNPGGVNTVNRRVVDAPVNDYGFFGPPPPFEDDPETTTVVLTGGSVATELYLYGRQALAERFEELGAGRVEIISLALGGMKQPQQLMALNWFLALGSKFDVVVNLDGFNELVLAFEQAEHLDVFPAYPSRWRILAAQRVSLGGAEVMGRISDLRRRRERLRRIFSGPVARDSSLSLATWHAVGIRFDARAATLDAELAAALGSGNAQELGPPYQAESRRDLFEDAAAVWSRSSSQMWQVARANRIGYLHFLQPSQYVRDSKKLTERERKVAFRESTASSLAVRAGYPLLQSAGRRMRAKGVPFQDLTGVFRDVVDSVYRDQCCHLSDRGYEILARHIAEGIARTVLHLPAD